MTFAAQKGLVNLCSEVRRAGAIRRLSIGQFRPTTNDVGNNCDNNCDLDSVSLHNDQLSCCGEHNVKLIPDHIKQMIDSNQSSHIDWLGE